MDKRQKAVGLIFGIAITTIFFVIDNFWIALIFVAPWALLGALLILFLRVHQITPSHQPKLIDKYLPEYQFNEITIINIQQPKEVVYQTIWRLDYSRSLILKTYLFLRGMPHTGLSVEKLIARNACLLDENKNEEFVLGIIVKPWTLSGDLRRFNPQAFIQWQNPGFMKVAWSFFVEEKGSGQSRLYAETRFFCTDKRGKRYFEFYWALIRPFSDIVRWALLRFIKRVAESK